MNGCICDSLPVFADIHAEKGILIKGQNDDTVDGPLWYKVHVNEEVANLLPNKLGYSTAGIDTNQASCFAKVLQEVHDRRLV